jgi:simple sugar transport system permease protein
MNGRVSAGDTITCLSVLLLGPYAGALTAAADALGINVLRQRYLYVFVGGLLAGLAGATISLAISPGWFSELTTGGLGWIAVGLVIFAQWDPFRAMFGAYAFGALRRLIERERESPL